MVRSPRRQRVVAAAPVAVSLLAVFAPSPARAQGAKEGKDYTIEGAELKTSAKGTRYMINVPKAYDKEKGGELAINFWGGGGNPTYKSALYDIWWQKAWRESAIVVSPDSAQGDRWQATPGADVNPIADLIRELQKEYRPTRTILTGFGHGSDMAFAVALAYPDLVQAAIPQGGNSFVPLGECTGRKPVFYVIISEGARSKEDTLATVKKLETAGLTVQVEKPKGDGSLDSAALGRGIAWVEKALGPPIRPLTDAEAAERLKALETALGGRDWSAATAAFKSLAGAPRKIVPKLVALTSAHCESQVDELALAAIELAGTLGEDGVKTLKKVSAKDSTRAKAAAAALGNTRSPRAAEALLVLLKCDNEEVAVAAAKELGNLSGDGALTALIAGLEKAEVPAPDARKAAILDALKDLTGQSFATSKEWRRWLKERG